MRSTMGVSGRQSTRRSATARHGHAGAQITGRPSVRMPTNTLPPPSSRAAALFAAASASDEPSHRALRSRRSAVLRMLGAGIALPLASDAVMWPTPASAAGVADLARDFLRPEITPVDAVVSLMDARSTLREISEIAATPQDSQIRFQSRKLWPGFAKVLREVGPAAPVVAALVGGTDSEATLSDKYGGSAGATAGPVDRVYQGLGTVLTISGRTIQGRAQVDPELANDARNAIEEVLGKVPKEVADAAMEFRMARAAARN